MFCANTTLTLDIMAHAGVNILSSVIGGEDAVVIFDIDNTLVANNGKPIRPMIDLYNYAAKKFKMAIITARVDDFNTTAFTIKQLSSLGIQDYMRIYFRPTNETDVYTFKLKSRENLYKDGFRCVLSIGDSNWDIGAYGGIGMLIPYCPCLG